LLKYLKAKRLKTVSKIDGENGIIFEEPFAITFARGKPPEKLLM